MRYPVNVLPHTAQPFDGLKDISTPDFSTPDLSTPDFSTINFWTMGLKSSWMKSLGLKCHLSRRLNDISTPDFSSMNFSFIWFKKSWLKSPAPEIRGWKIWGWKNWGWSMGLKSPGLRFLSTFWCLCKLRFTNLNMSENFRIGKFSWTTRTFPFLLSSSRHVSTNFSKTNLRIISPIFISYKRKQISFWSKKVFFSALSIWENKNKCHLIFGINNL